MAKKQSHPVVRNQSTDEDIALARKIKIDLFRAILKATYIHVSPERYVLLNELRRALNATASLRAKLGDKDAYTERPMQ